MTPRSLRLAAAAMAGLIGLSVAVPSLANAVTGQASTINRTIDPAALAAYRDALLAKQSTAIELSNATIKAVYAERVQALGYDPVITEPREIARQIMLNKYGWGEEQFTCYDNIIMRESRWNPRADNPHSTAYGIPQALPGSRMAAFGADWRTNPVTQIRWGLDYVSDRYGTPCSAWSFKRARGWY